MNESLDKISKYLSYILRHKPEAIEITLDDQGWVDINTLIIKANQHGQIITQELIELIIQKSDKKRFMFSTNGLKIRAAQGHSTKQVDINYPEQIPPNFLYHGTAKRFMDSITQQGLLPGKRHYVHLSVNEETAISVATRHGKPILLTIKALLMYQQGFKFYLADNGVWITKIIPTEFIIE